MLKPEEVGKYAKRKENENLRFRTCLLYTSPSPRD